MKSKGLTAVFCKSITERGDYADLNGLYLSVSKWGTKSWIFRYRYNGIQKKMGLGPMSAVTLAEAREKAVQLRKLLLDGIDPAVKREADKHAQVIEAAQNLKFKEAADQFITAHAPAWKHFKQEQQYRNSLEKYANPVIGDLPVQAINTELVLKVLQPIWVEKTETAMRVRNRIERILEWARVRGYRDGANPAAWRNCLDSLLPKPSKVRKVTNFASLPYQQANAFIMKLRERSAMTAYALEFAILTTTRTNETVGAKWSEFDFAMGVWVIPGKRMKAGATHRVPLTKRMLEILAKVKPLSTPDGYVFPGTKPGRMLTENSMLGLIERMGYKGIATTHGFRATFKTWAHEQTNHPRELIESQLAHTLKNKAEAAYMRSDMLDRRRSLIEDWDSFLKTPFKTSETTPTGLYLS